MKLRTKKVIAKEILYFFIGIVIIILFWSSIKIRNYYYENKVISSNTKISDLQSTIYKLENLNDLLIIPSKRNVFNNNIEILKRNNSTEQEIILMTKEFKDKFSIESVLKKYVDTANNPKYNSDFEVINSLFPELNGYDNTLLKSYVATANNENYNSNFVIINSKFPEFFNEQIKIDKLKNIKKTETDKRNKTKLKIVNRDEIIQIITNLSIVIMGLLYPIRIVFISVIWAIKIIKTS